MTQEISETHPRSSTAPVLVWFRDDLRLSDHPALMATVETGRPIIAVYNFEQELDLRPLGGAAQWWLHHALEALDESLRAHGNGLHIFQAASSALIPALAKSMGCHAVFWNRRYGEAERSIDAEIKNQLREDNIEAQSFNGHLLYEPWQVQSKTGTPFKVFTPYWRAARQNPPAPPLPAPQAIPAIDKPLQCAHAAPIALASLSLLPQNPDWAKSFHAEWQPHEKGAHTQLSQFLEAVLDGYAEGRNRPDYRSSSRLSPYLRFGNISARQAFHAAQSAFDAGETGATQQDLDKFHSEIGWREFSYHLLFYFPQLAKENFQKRFDAFPWQEVNKQIRNALKAWQKGQTGYPIIDAGMRELWQTGWMHNRVRMIVASFLIKHLLIDWREGEAWFWDTLVDADPASNPASWQWVAGSGADAAPYYRIFNPVLQGTTHDPNGDYVRKFVPELALLPKDFIHRPYDAPNEVLKKAGVVLGKAYPFPIIGLEEGRNRALQAFQALKEPEML